MILLENEKVCVKFDQSIPAVVWTPLEEMSDEEFREPLRVGVRFFQQNIDKYPNMGWISDTYNCKTVKLDDVNWAAQEINLAYVSAGGTKVAFVFPENIFARMALRLYSKYTNSTMRGMLEIKVFDDFESAKHWIQEKVTEKMKAK